MVFGSLPVIWRKRNFTKGGEPVTKDHDLIYRQAALEVLETSADLIRRALDCTDLVGAERDKFECGLGLIEPLIYDMESLPSVDAVPVVYCKDCIHWDERKGEKYCEEMYFNQDDPKFYCGYAERRENAVD